MNNLLKIVGFLSSVHPSHLLHGLAPLHIVVEGDLGEQTCIYLFYFTIGPFQRVLEGDYFVLDGHSIRDLVKFVLFE